MVRIIILLGHKKIEVIYSTQLTQSRVIGFVFEGKCSAQSWHGNRLNYRVQERGWALMPVADEQLMREGRVWVTFERRGGVFADWEAMYKPSILSSSLIYSWEGALSKSCLGGGESGGYCLQFGAGRAKPVRGAGLEWRAVGLSTRMGILLPPSKRRLMMLFMCVSHTLLWACLCLTNNHLPRTAWISGLILGEASHSGISWISSNARSFPLMGQSVFLKLFGVV